MVTTGGDRRSSSETARVDNAQRAPRTELTSLIRTERDRPIQQLLSGAHRTSTRGDMPLALSKQVRVRQLRLVSLPL